MASPVSSLFGQNTQGPNPTSATSTANSTAPTEQMFLQLLVTQIQNQDPLNPADGTQFVAQLAQFSELEQVIGIRGDIESGMAAQAAAAANNQAATNTQTSNNPATSDTSGTGATAQN